MAGRTCPGSDSGTCRAERVSDLRARDLRQLLLAGSAFAASARGGRRMVGRVGRERRRVGVLGRAQRGGASGVRRASACDPRRGRRHDIGLAGSERVRLGARLHGERNRIVISDYEFPTVGQIAHAQALRGAEVVRVLAQPDGSIPPERFAQSVDERTALVCCTTVSFRTGHRHDVSSIAEVAHASGALAPRRQLPGRGRPRARRAQPRRRRGHGWHRQVLVGVGGARLHVGARVAAAAPLLPTQTGWFADEDIFAMSIADYSPHATARRFDGGTPPVPSLYPGVAGVQLIAEVGVPAIEAHVSSLVDRLLAGLDELGATVVTPRERSGRGPLACVASTDPNALVDSVSGPADRHLDPRPEPSDLAPPLQRRGGRRPDSRSAGRESRTARLTAASRPRAEGTWQSRAAARIVLADTRRIPGPRSQLRIGRDSAVSPACVPGRSLRACRPRPRA